MRKLSIFLTIHGQRALDCRNLSTLTAFRLFLYARLPINSEDSGVSSAP